jgi:hypothetical protein
MSKSLIGQPDSLKEHKRRITFLSRHFSALSHWHISAPRCGRTVHRIQKQKHFRWRKTSLHLIIPVAAAQFPFARIFLTGAGLIAQKNFYIKRGLEHGSKIWFRWYGLIGLRQENAQQIFTYFFNSSWLMAATIPKAEPEFLNIYRGLKVDFP